MPTSGDDDDGSVIIIRKAKAALTSPVASAKRWHFVAVAVAALLIGLAF
jgi:hypothetical protein